MRIVRRFLTTLLICEGAAMMMSVQRLRATLRSVLRFSPIEINRETRRLRRLVNVSDFRKAAKRRLPRGVFDYIDGGAEDERTLRANCEAFSNVIFRPRVLCGVGEISIAGRVLGESTSFPFAMAPTGFTRIADPQGELAVARSAQRAGIPYTLSTLGTRSIEEVRASAPDARLWFQVYATGFRELVAEMVDADLQSVALESARNDRSA